jgi:serine/threonine protein kinase
MVLDTAPPYQVRILDFGIASVLSIFWESGDITQQGMTRGTPSYMAPEMFTEAGRPSIESDLYSVGLVYMEMLTGKPVFSSDSYTEVAFKHMHSPLEIPGFIPESIADIILRLCEKKPENRYHSAYEVIECIDACIDTAIAEEKECASQFEKMPSYHNNYSSQHAKIPRDDITPPKPKLQIPIPLIAVGILIVAALVLVIIGIIQRQATTAQHAADTAISQRANEEVNLRLAMHQLQVQSAIQIASAKVEGLWQLSVTLTDLKLDDGSITPANIENP